LNTVKDRSVFGQYDDQAIFEQKGAGRSDLEEELILDRVVLGAFENEGDVFRFELDTGQFVRVDRRLKSVFIAASVR